MATSRYLIWLFQAGGIRRFLKRAAMHFDSLSLRCQQYTQSVRLSTVRTEMSSFLDKEYSAVLSANIANSVDDSHGKSYIKTINSLGPNKVP